MLNNKNIGDILNKVLFSPLLHSLKLLPLVIFILSTIHHKSQGKPSSKYFYFHFEFKVLFSLLFNLSIKQTILMDTICKMV